MTPNTISNDLFRLSRASSHPNTPMDNLPCSVSRLWQHMVTWLTTNAGCSTQERICIMLRAHAQTIIQGGTYTHGCSTMRLCCTCLTSQSKIGPWAVQSGSTLLTQQNSSNRLGLMNNKLPVLRLNCVCQESSFRRPVQCCTRIEKKV